MDSKPRQDFYQQTTDLRATIARRAAELRRTLRQRLRSIQRGLDGIPVMTALSLAFALGLTALSVRALGHADRQDPNPAPRTANRIAPVRTQTAVPRFDDPTRYQPMGGGMAEAYREQAEEARRAALPVSLTPPTLYLVRTQQDQTRLAEALGLPPDEISVVFIATPDDEEHIRRGIEDVNVIRATEGLPPILIVDIDDLIGAGSRP